MNKDLFERLLYAKDGLEIEWVHVKGHATSEGNIRADALARSSLDDDLMEYGPSNKVDIFIWLQ